MRLSFLKCESFLALTLPSVCPCCGYHPGPTLCRACQTQVVAIDYPCQRCASPRTDANAVCRNCFDSGWPFIKTIHTSLAYTGIVCDLVAQVKARGDRAAARALMNLLTPPSSHYQAIIPIPPSRGRGAGPHLPTVMARLAARQTGAHMTRAIRLRRQAARQHELAQSDRERNVQAVFSVQTKIPERVLLVDDLLTTGATLRAAARALGHAGARHIDVWVAARTPRHDDDQATSEADIHAPQPA